MRILLLKLSTLFSKVFSNSEVLISFSSMKNTLFLKVKSLFPKITSREQIFLPVLKWFSGTRQITFYNTEVAKLKIIFKHRGDN